MLSHLRVELLERVSKIRRYDIIGESMSLRVGFKVANALSRLSPLPLCGYVSVSVSVCVCVFVPSYKDRTLR